MMLMTVSVHVHRLLRSGTVVRFLCHNSYDFGVNICCADLSVLCMQLQRVKLPKEFAIPKKNSPPPVARANGEARS